MKVKQCPNAACSSRHGRWNYIRKGYYKTKWNAQPVRRYLCNDCGVSFSSHTFLSTYKQKRPDLNQAIFQWYVSGTTQRRMAKVLGINRKTVVRKFLFMAGLARKEHEKQTEKVSLVQFDEMESFEHSRLKPLSIALAVDGLSGKLIEIQTASFPCKGKRAFFARQKYGVRPDDRLKARTQVLERVSQRSEVQLTLLTDLSPSYPALIKTILPKARLEQVKSIFKPLMFRHNRRNTNDKLFTLNYTAAKLRHDLSRLARRVWVTTKKASRLQAHLDLYLAFHNGYSLN